jgi:plastocyanin
MNYSKTNWHVKRIAFSILAIGFFGAWQAASAADITGTITLQGTPPAEKEITPLMENSDCAAMYNGKAPTTHFYAVGPKGEFADVVVSLKGVSGKSTGASAPAAVMDQKGCLYTPQIMAIQTGQKLVVKNSDNCVHNVHSVPAVDGNTSHNDVQMIGGADLTYTFTKPEMFLKFQCDVHNWMFAWVSVFDSPFYCITDKDGNFVIKNVPPGKYTLEANHRKLGAQTKDVEVTDKDAAVNFTFTVK